MIPSPRSETSGYGGKNPKQLLKNSRTIHNGNFSKENWP